LNLEWKVDADISIVNGTVTADSVVSKVTTLIKD
jgi:hypothetical protein